MAAARGFAFSTDVPPPPDHVLARAFRESSCPRQMCELTIYNFGEDPDQLNTERVKLTAQLNELFRKMYPIISAEFQLQRRIEMDMNAKDLRYKMRVSNEFNAKRLVKRMSGFKLGKEDDPWAKGVRRSYTQDNWDALIDEIGQKKFKVSIVQNPILSHHEKAAYTGDNRFARFGLSIYLYFFGIRRLALLMCIVAVLSLPAVMLNLKGNLAATPGCFDGEFPIAPLACVAFVSAGNVPTFSRYNETVSSGESSLSHHDRHLLFSFLDVMYTCVYLLGLHKLSTGVRALTADSGDNLTASDYTIQVSGFSDDLRDPKLIRDFFEFRFGPVVEVNVVTRSSRLLKASDDLRRKKESLHIALARSRNKTVESKQVSKLRAAVKELRVEIAELAVAIDSDTDQRIVGAFVKFDKWEDCQKALDIYGGFFRGYLNIDRNFRWTGLSEVPGSVGAAEAAAMKRREARAKVSASPGGEDGSSDSEDGGDRECGHGSQPDIVQAETRPEALWRWILARTCPQNSDDGDGDEKELGYRLLVERAPKPANIIWEGFGHSSRSLLLRRTFAGFVSFALVIVTVAAFVIAHLHRGSAPIACDIAVCDDRLEYPLSNKNASFTRAVLGTSTEGNVTSIGLGCAHHGLEEAEAADDAVSSKGTKVVFRGGLTNGIGRPTCIGGYEFCQGLKDEVRRDLEFSVCEQAYFKARLFSNPGFEYLPWAALILVNVLLRWSVKHLVRKIECHTSTAARELSVAKRLFMWQFINTALAIWVAHAITAGMQSQVPGTAAPDATTGWGVAADSGGAGAPPPPATEQTDGLLGAQWYRETGTGLTVALLINSLLPRTGVYLRGKCGKCARSRCCTLSCCVATQEQLNKRYAGQELDLSERYACIWNTVFCTMLYCSGLPALLLIAAVDLHLLYRTEQKALFKHYAKRDPNDDNEDLAVLSSQILNCAAVIHLIGAMVMYTDAAVWAKETITDSEYAKTRARGRNATVVVEGSSGILDSASDALGRRHVALIVLVVLILVAFHTLKLKTLILKLKTLILKLKIPAVPEKVLQVSNRLKLTNLCTRLERVCSRGCQRRVAPERVYRTYTQSIDDMKLAGGSLSYDIRDCTSVSAALDQHGGGKLHSGWS